LGLRQEARVVVADVELVLLAARAGLAGAIGLRFMWSSHRIPTPRRIMHTAVDPITGPRNRVDAYDTGGSFIPMPNHLKTRDEMVAWMTNELPKLMTEIPKPD
jgi:hypothetical protein